MPSTRPSPWLGRAIAIGLRLMDTEAPRGIRWQPVVVDQLSTKLGTKVSILIFIHSLQPFTASLFLNNEKIRFMTAIGLRLMDTEAPQETPWQFVIDPAKYEIGMES